ncbi:MAG TPA: hypothetical protein VGO49_08360 [Bradyrhizobium sp.]|jgi:hypothetical protein|nr:hypothetical protein [Bradyrhizobium sp.]
MQYYFSLLPEARESVEKTLSLALLSRYLGAAKGDKNRAIRLYIWNADLSREFYLPIQLTEVALRNSIHNQLTALYGNLWFETSELLSAVPQRTQVEVKKVASRERVQRGSAFTVDQVVAGLPFGFWLSLLNSSMTERLWSGNIRPIFPHLPSTLHRPDVHKRLERLRLFRNAVMHHYAIFDKGTTAEWENIKLILGWICPTTAQFMTQLADPKKVLSAKPTV